MNLWNEALLLVMGSASVHRRESGECCYYSVSWTRHKPKACKGTTYFKLHIRTIPVSEIACNEPGLDGVSPYHHTDSDGPRIGVFHKFF